MKKTLTLLALAIISLSSFSQEIFETNIEMDSCNSLFCVEEIDGFYYVGGDYLSENLPLCYVGGYLAKLNNEGEVVEEYFNEENYFSNYYFLVKGENCIIAMGSDMETENSMKKLRWTKFDLNLEPIESKIIDIDYHGRLWAESIMLDGDVVFLTVRSISFEDTFEVNYILKLSLPDGEVLSEYNSGLSTNFAGICGLVESIDTTQISVIESVKCYHLPKSLDSVICKYSIIMSEEVLSTSDYIKGIRTPDSCYIYSGYFDSYQSSDDLVLLKTNKDGEYLDHLRLGQENFSNLYAIPGGIPMAHNKDFFYAAFTAAHNPVPNIELPNIMHIYKVDYNLDTIWGTTIGGDANYKLKALSLTSDGGCIITGMKYDFMNEANKRWDSFVMKISSNGDFLWKKEYVTNNTLLIYPNPGRDFIQLDDLDYVKQATLMFYSPDGKIALEKTVSPHEKVVTSELTSGLYLYKVVGSMGNLLGSGRWIKQ